MSRAEPPTDGSQNSLQRVLGRRDLLALAWGAMIGWGWVVLSAEMASRAGTIGSALAFAVGAAMLLLVGALYAELTAMMPRAGGELAFCLAGLGPVASAFCGWILCLAYLAVCAFEAVALPRVLFHLAPGLETRALFEIAGAPVSASGVAIGSLGVIAIAVVNFRGIRPAAMLQGAAALTLAVAGASLFLSAAWAGETTRLAPEFTDAGGFMTVVIMTPFLLFGFDVIPQVAEEIRASARQVGAVILAAILLALCWYAAVQLSVGVLLDAPTRELVELAPVAAMENLYGNAWAGRWIILGGIFGILTSWNAFFVGGARLLFAMGRGGMLPTGFSRVHAKFGTPSYAIALLAALSLVAPWLGHRALGWFVNAGSFATVLAYLLVVCAFLAIRCRHPDWRSAGESEVRVPAAGWIGGAALFATAGFTLLYLPGSPVALRWPHEWGILLTWLALGIPLCALRFATGAFDRTRAAERILGRPR